MAKGTAESIDAIVTDPPYGLGFMGKQWDALPPGEEWARECLRVLKPGGHLLAFGGTRTYHRLAVALEDAGFEIRDCIAWMYGTGFPKSLDISKAIDKAAGAEREVTGKGTSGKKRSVLNAAKYPESFGGDYDVTAPATPAAEDWQGWGTALKPAFEPIVVARKPLSEKTVAANAQRWGTGALNIDGTRLEYEDEADKASATPQGRVTSHDSTSIGAKPNIGQSIERTEFQRPEQKGRWPANVALDEEAAGLLDEQGEARGVHSAGSATKGSPNGGRDFKATSYDHRGKGARIGDDGGASRFFYVAKASRKERGEGNDHPTVKPVELMRWLVRLVTPPGGRVLDPFMGSGTTGIAALAEGFNFIGIELDSHYYDIAQTRIATVEETANDAA